MESLPRLRLMGDSDCWELEFIARGGRLNAAEAQVEAHTSNTVLITGDAEANGLGAAFACLAREGGYEGIAAHDLGDLFRLKLFAHLAMDGVRQWRWSKDGAARIDAAGLHAVVVDLREHAGTVFVNCAGHTPVSGNHVGIKTMDQFLISPIARVDRLLLCNDEATATLRALGIVGDEARPGQVLFGEVRQVGREDDAIRNNRLADAYGCE